MRLRMQAACRVDDDHVAAPLAGELDRVVGDRGRVAAALAADEVSSRALRPDLELLFGGGAEGVRRAEHDRAPVFSQPGGELADSGRLAGAVHANDEDHTRLLVEGQPARLPQQLRGLFDERVTEIAKVSPSLEPPNELGGRRHPDVRRDQRLFEPFPGRLVGGVEGSCGDLLRQCPPALAEGVAQPREEAARVGGLLRPGGVNAEQLGPGPAHACGVRFRSASLNRREAGRRWSATTAATPAAASFHDRRSRARVSITPPTVASGPSVTSGERSIAAILWLSDGSSRCLTRHPAGDDLRDTVGAHRDAVEAVSGFHGPLLVRDHDELSSVGVAAEQLDEAADVRVVERRLDLVEEIEGTRPREEEREQEGDGTESLLAAGEERELRDALAHRAQLDLDSRLAAVVRAVLVGLAQP